MRIFFSDLDGTLLDHNTYSLKGALEGIELLKRNRDTIKGVILDMSMPEISGKETYIKMKEIVSDLKVILTSGFRQDERVDEVLELGIKHFVEKPYTIEKLSEAVYNHFN